MARKRVGPVATGAKSCYVTIYRIKDGYCSVVRRTLKMLGAVYVDTVPSEAVGWLWEDTFRIPIKYTVARVESILRNKGIFGRVGFSCRNGRVCHKDSPFAAGGGNAECAARARKQSVVRLRALQKEAGVGKSDPMPQSVMESCYPDGIDWVGISLSAKTAPRSSGGVNSRWTNNEEWFAHCETWEGYHLEMADYHCLCLSWSAFEGVYWHLQSVEASLTITPRLDKLIEWVNVWLRCPEAKQVKSDYVALNGEQKETPLPAIAGKSDDIDTAMSDGFMIWHYRLLADYWPK